MDRKALHSLHSWYNKTPSKPLIVRGARQVGKSTLVRLFCQNLEIDLIELDFEIVKLREIENDTSFSIEKVLEEIELVSGRKITKRSLLFFDEVQGQPRIINRLRYFYEKRPDLRVIAAGSLLEVTLDALHSPMPVGRVQYLQLGPMTFSEFLQAKQEDIFLEQLEKRGIRDASDATWLDYGSRLLKEYYFVGGMPEAVQCWVHGGDTQDVRDIHNSILHTYRDDIPKYSSKKEYARVSDVFEYTGAHIGEKVVFSDISHAHSLRVRSSIDLLAKAGVIIKTVHTSCKGLPLAAGTEPATMKLFFLDIGLLNAMHDTRWSDIFSLPSEYLLTKGSMAEQFIAQHLKGIDIRNPSPELYYWLHNRRKRAAEIDFIHSHAGTILPIEVKAGKTGKIKSLWKYIEQQGPEFVVKFDLMERRERVREITHKALKAGDGHDLRSILLALPLFEIEYLPEYLDDLM
ncbi:MAG: ATP-binding protein [Sphaerochaetaceae bacterium]|nr:ATP-binding protein [Sphaerochaetaceae bacterium]